MPLVTAVVLAYAAGLLSGYGVPLLYTAGAAACIVWLGARTTRDRIAVAAVATGGLAIATTARSLESSCLNRLIVAHEWEATLAADAGPGDFALARHACGVELRIVVQQGRADAGARLSIRGEASLARGLLIAHAAIREVKAPSMLSRWRSAIGRGIDRHFGADAPLVRALLIADTHDLSPTVRSRFAAAGFAHLLAVAGLHVGLIAAAVALGAQLFGLPRGRADVVVVATTTAYVLVIGAPLPSVRAAVMLATYSLSRAVQRPTSRWAVLAVGAAVPLLDPRAVLHVGYQLTVVGMTAIIAAGALTRRWRWLATGGWRGTLYHGIAVSTMASLLTAPLVAATFGRVTVIGPLSNIVALPMMAVLQPMLFLAALLLPLPPAAQFVADACHPLLVGIDHVASVAAALPGASIPVVSDPVTTALACAGGAALAVACVSRFPGRALLVSGACVAALAWRPMIRASGGTTELHVIDVGQGDAIALRTARGRWVLFDAGRDWPGGDEGQRDVIPYLGGFGGPLVAFVLSHPHADHAGGAASTLRAFTPELYYDPGYAGGTTPYLASLLEAQRLHTSWRRVHPGDSLIVDEVTIAFLAPDSVWAESQRDPNLASAVVRASVGEVAFLLTGDAEAPEEQWLLDHAQTRLRADVLKVAHHGSNTSSTSEFLEAVRPRLAIVSVGAGNRYGHPSPDVMQSLAAHGAIALRTDVDGTVVVRTNGHNIDVEAHGERWTLRP